MVCREPELAVRVRIRRRCETRAQFRKAAWRDDRQWFARSAHTLREANDAKNSPWLAEAEVALAECFIDLCERKAACTLVGEAQAIHADNAEPGEHFKAPLRKVLERVKWR